MGQDPTLYSRKDWNRMRRKSAGFFKPPAPLTIGGLGNDSKEFTGCDFSGFDLRNVTFQAVYFWPRCNFSGCDFRGSEFIAASFEDANMSGADLRGCTFKSGTFNGSDLTNTQCKGTKVLNAPNPEGGHVPMTGFSFRGADLTGVSDLDPKALLCAADWKEIQGNPRLLAKTERAALAHMSDEEREAAEQRQEALNQTTALKQSGKAWGTNTDFDQLWNLATTAQDSDFKRILFRQYVENARLSVGGGFNDDTAADPVSMDGMIAFLDSVDLFEGVGGIDTHESDAGYVRVVQNRGWTIWHMIITKSSNGGYAYMSSERERD